MWLFSHKKAGDLVKGEASSVLWQHSRGTHGGGGLGIQLTSILFTALSRHVTEAVQITQGMDWVKLLNNK